MKTSLSGYLSDKEEEHVVGFMGVLVNEISSSATILIGVLQALQVLLEEANIKQEELEFATSCKRIVEWINESENAKGSRGLNKAGSAKHMFQNVAIQFKRYVTIYSNVIRWVGITIDIIMVEEVRI
ncbi:hypothetical protein AAHE18_11G230700 [Arachis hypogaea]